jgi:hypothetical protein
VAAAGLSARPILVEHSATSATRPFEVLLLVALVVSAVAVLAGLVGLLAGRSVRGRGRDHEEPRELIRAPSSRFTLAGVFTVAVAVVALVVWLAPRVVRSLSAGVPGPSSVPSGVGSASPSTGTASSPASGSPGWLLWGLLVGLVLLAVLTVVRRARARSVSGRTPVGAAGRDQAERSLGVVSDAEQALAAPGSPRSAVIGSYLAMERALAASGSPREPVVTPGEFVALAGAEHPSAARSAAELTEVFERARFSGQSIGKDDVSTARQALGELRRALGGR